MVMSTFFFILFLLVLLSLLIALLIFASLKITSLVLFTGAPYIEIPKEILSHIVQALELHDDSHAFDLGCGDGRVLLACHDQKPRATYVGIDNALLPVLTSKWKIGRIKPAPNIKVIRENFFNSNLSEATHVFIYLFPALINKLLPKLERELRPGTRLVSCDYQFTNKKPIEIIDLKRGKGQLGKFLYIYEF